MQQSSISWQKKWHINGGGREEGKKKEYISGRNDELALLPPKEFDLRNDRAKKVSMFLGTEGRKLLS